MVALPSRRRTKMLFDVELHCDKWKNCKTKWCNNDGGFWCKEDCKLLQVNSPSNRKKVEKILSNGDAVYILYADGTWRKKEKKWKTTRPEMLPWIIPAIRMRSGKRN